MKPYYEENGITIYHGDCRDILPSLPKVDLVLTDPPYGKLAGASADGGSKAIGGKGFVEANKYDLSWDTYTINHPDLDLIFLHGMNYIIWGANYFWDHFKPTNSLIVWDKKCQNGWDDTFSDGEIAISSYGKKLTIYRQLWVGALKSGETVKRQHPTEKPPELMRWILGTYITEPFKTVIDPFMGSGTTLRAAKDLGKNCIGIEINEQFCDIAVRRLQQEVLPLTESTKGIQVPTIDSCPPSGDLFKLT